MRGIMDPDGKPMIKRVLTREEVYGNDAPPQAPDIFFELGDYWLVGQFHSGKLFAEEIQDKHDPMGIFLACGPDFASGTTVDGLNMQDMTPLILHLLGLGVPRDCDGTVPVHVFADSSEAKTRAVQTAEPIARSTAAKSHANEKASLSNAIRNIKF
jgi:predicted AlkP superfamily phosphohydrolase/phosphomutase